MARARASCALARNLRGGGSLRAGETYNVIPDTAQILGCVRTYDMELYKIWGKLIAEAAEGAAAACGASCEVKYAPGHPAVVGAEKWAEFISQKSGGKMTLKVFPSTLGGDVQTTIVKLIG